MKRFIMGLVYSVSAVIPATGLAQQTTSPHTAETLQDWKQKFGACLNDTNNFSKEIKDYSDIAILKATAQLQNVNNLNLGDEYSAYIRALVRLRPLAQDLKRIRELDRTGYFKDLFQDPRFQDFSTSNNFAILDLLKPDGDFFNISVNKDPRLAKLMNQVTNGTDAASVELKTTWQRLVTSFASDSERSEILQSLTVLKSLGDGYKINVSIIDPILSVALIDYSSFLAANLKVEVTSNTTLKEIPFPATLARANNRYANNFAELSSEIIASWIKRSLLVPDLKADDLKSFLQKNPIAATQLKNIVKVKKADAVASEESLLNYLNSIKRPRQFAFDQFLVDGYWGSDTNKKFMFQVGSHPVKEVSSSEMAAIDGLARTLVGEAMSCQTGGSNQFEAIGLVFAERAKAIDDYYKMNSLIAMNTNDEVFFEKQKEILYSPNVSAQFYKYLSNNLRGALDFGRKDTKGKLLHPVSQALSAPLQFDSWQAVRTQKTSLRSILPEVSKNIPEINLDFYLPQSTQEAAVFNTVLCPLPPAHPERIVQNQGMFNVALEVAANVVLYRDEYMKRFQFVTSSGSSVNEVYFYTHGVPLSFAVQVPTKQLKDNVTNRTLPLIPQKVIGACGQVMFFKATPQNSYRLAPK